MPAEHARLNRILHELGSRSSVHHAVMAVERGDLSLRWAGATGEANAGGPPMRPDTPFFIASITKTFVAAATLLLHERGHLHLESPLAGLLPALHLRGLHRLTGVDHTPEITVRHLLAHTSGLPDYIEERPRGGRTLIDQLIDDGDRTVTLDEALDIVRRLTPHFPPQPVDSPRQRVRYSDTNYRLLMAIIEAATGRPLHQSFRDLIFEPLSLGRTWHPEGAPLDGSADVATLWFGRVPLHIPRALASVGDLYSTVDDLFAFMRALVSGRLFERRDTWLLMQRRFNRFGLPRDRASLRTPGWPIEYGLGLMRFQLPRLFTPLRRVPAVIGHTGSTGSWLFYCEERDLYLAGTIDQGTAGAVPFRLVPRLLRALDR